MPERTAESVFRCRWGTDDEGRKAIFVHLLRGSHDEAGEFFAGAIMAATSSTIETSDGKMIGMRVTESFFGRMETEALLERISHVIGTNRLCSDEAMRGFIADVGNRIEFKLREMAEQGLVEVLEVV